MKNSFKISIKNSVENTNTNTILVFVSLLVLVLISRWASHLWNFTLVGGVFLFAGAYFQQKRTAVVLMLTAMLMSDFVIGFHNQMLSVYFSYALVLALGFLLKANAEELPARFKVFGFSVLGSFVFYAITNFSVWFEGSLYPMTFSGLVESYVMGIPFYRNQLISDILFSSLFFEVARAVPQIGFQPVSKKI